MEHAVYLDHNATAPIRPEAAEAVLAHLGSVGNPSSVHRFGRLARLAVEEARGRVARLVGAGDSDVIFTSGGTEANNLALAAGGRGGSIVVSAIEHDSVLGACGGVSTIPVNEDGIVDLQALDAMVADGADLVSVMLANNETGVVQPVAEVAAIARGHGALVHCDAVQAAGKIAIDLPALGVHMLSLSAHKLGGPGGVGALVVDGSFSIEPMLRGGSQEGRRRAGTENVAGIVGFGVAAELAGNGLEAFAGLAVLRDRLEQRLARLAPGTQFFGASVRRLPNTSCLAAPGLDSETQVMALDLDGVAISAGSACSSGKVGVSHVLAAMGWAEASSAIRVSLGWNSRETDINRFLDSWGALHARAARDPASTAVA
jgi:cysteine desulfurase